MKKIKLILLNLKLIISDNINLVLTLVFNLAIGNLGIYFVINLLRNLLIINQNAFEYSFIYMVCILVIIFLLINIITIYKYWIDSSKYTIAVLVACGSQFNKMNLIMTVILDLTIVTSFLLSLIVTNILKTRLTISGMGFTLGSKDYLLVLLITITITNIFTYICWKRKNLSIASFL